MAVERGSCWLPDLREYRKKGIRMEWKGMELVTRMKMAPQELP